MMAARPKTLPAAFVPVIVGGSVAYASGMFSIVNTVVALICAILIQIGTNFTNDLYDYIKGADTAKRVGPTRVLNSGLVTPREMQFAITLVFGLTFLLGLYLVYESGPITFVIGVVSIIAGLAYTAGPFPLAYNGLGDLFVFLFFGIVGTTGTYFVNVKSFSAVSFLASVPVGALITNILVVNNYRDIEQDKVAGKYTLAVKLGKRFALFEYVVFVGCSFLVPFILYYFYKTSAWVFLPYLTLPLAYKLIMMLLTLTGSQLNKALEMSAKFSLLFGVLLSLGFIIKY